MEALVELGGRAEMSKVLAGPCGENDAGHLERL